MKTYQLIISILLCSVLLFNAKCPSDIDDKPNIQYTITGKLVKSCDNPIPMINRSFDLWYNTNGGGKSDLKATATTDSLGNFKLIYTTTPHSVSSTLDIIEANGFGQKTLLANILQNTNIDIGNIYTDTNVFIVAKIKTEKTYSTNDTLFYFLGSFSANKKFIVGPFANNQILDTIVTHQTQGSLVNSSSQSSNYYSRWLLGVMYFDNKGANEITTPVTQCKKYNEVVLDLTKSIY